MSFCQMLCLYCTSRVLQKVQDSSQKRKLIKSYRQEDLFIVRETYTPCDVLDLYAQAEDIVGVLKRKDPSGQEHRWYVDRGEMKGFLPQSILAPYQKQSQVGSLYQTQHSAESYSSLASSHCSSELLQPTSHHYENSVDLLTDHRYDTVPEETDPHSSLLSFDEVEHPAANFETANSLLQFDPLAPGFQKANSSTTTTKLPESSSNSQSGHSGTSGSSSLIPQPTLLENVYHAAYPFKAGDQNQLSLEFGQRVLVKQKCDLKGNGEWWLVKNSLGKEGYVPANYLRKN